MGRLYASWLYGFVHLCFKCRVISYLGLRVVWTEVEEGSFLRVDWRKLISSDSLGYLGVRGIHWMVGKTLFCK